VVALALGEYLTEPQATMHLLMHVSARLAGFHTHTIATVDGDVPYLDAGTGPPVLLIHGFQDAKESWVSFARHLTATHRVIIPDLHGFGENFSNAHGDYRPGAQAARMRTFLNGLDVRTVDVAGVSMGGEVAAEFAVRYPERTRTIALISSAGTRSDTLTPMGSRLLAGDPLFHVDTRARFDTLAAMIADSGMWIPDLFRRAAVDEFVARASEWDQAFAQLTAPDVLYVVDSLAPRIEAPTLVMWGAHDPIFHRSSAQRLGARLPHAEVTVFPNCGHLCPVSQAGELAERYLRFLREWSGR
jgi:abhydrolase domain-containing protein 6